MFKFLIAAALFYGIVKMWRKLKSPIAVEPSGRAGVGSSEMVACSGCGTFVLKDEALKMNGLVYCGKECGK